MYVGKWNVLSKIITIVHMVKNLLARLLRISQLKLQTECVWTHPADSPSSVLSIVCSQDFKENVGICSIISELQETSEATHSKLQRERLLVTYLTKPVKESSYKVFPDYFFLFFFYHQWNVLFNSGCVHMLNI